MQRERRWPYGNDLWLDGRCSPIRDIEGIPQRFLKGAIDVTACGMSMADASRW